MDLSRSWDYLVDIAVERLRHNKTARHVSVYGEKIELLGVVGEFAARVALGLPRQLHANFDGGRDLKYAGLSIDVKTTQLTSNLRGRFLQIPRNFYPHAEILLMMAADLERKIATPVGYATRSEVLAARQGPLNMQRRFPCYEIPVRDLHPFWELIERNASHSKAYESTDRLSPGNSPA